MEVLGGVGQRDQGAGCAGGGLVRALAAGADAVASRVQQRYPDAACYEVQVPVSVEKIGKAHIYGGCASRANGPRRAKPYSCWSGYLTARTGMRQFFYRAPNTDPAVMDADERLKGLSAVADSDSANLPPAQSPSRAIKVPTLLVTGDKGPYCTVGTCTSCAAAQANVQVEADDHRVRRQRASQRLSSPDSNRSTIPLSAFASSGPRRSSM